ncbi:protein kinase [Gordonia alkaliphila]|uniref:non-specific serine/threonine protein kinase n=1 Tax=Gordonia alkaliphila TaxID=1053547 RepID=A0ABP8Z602_9ACTN|nr:serine/threonine-protein kinase [Gordonia alkaliphila]MCK0440883.1 protein kinase [Gordonia alkaliphila]
MFADRVNTRFGPYQLQQLLGRGGMGEVYRAYDTGKQRTVALKLLRADLARDPVYRERFRRESMVAARLGEPHVIPIHDWGEIDGLLYIDMRLVQGPDLRKVLRTEQRLAPARAVAITEQIASALDAAHAGGLVHRDIKPENILVGDRDFAYLVDFGIAAAQADTRLTQVGSAIGSVAYMAPELFDGAPASPASDVYALTCVLCEALTGRAPFPAPPPVASAVVPGVPQAVDAVLARGLARDPSMRFGSAGELAAAARAALSTPESARAHTMVAPPPDRGVPGVDYPGPPPPPPRSKSVVPALIAVVGTVVVLAAAALVALMMLSGRDADEAASAPADAGQPLTSSATVQQVPTPLSNTPVSAAPPTSPTVRTYPAPTPHITASADPSAPGYIPPPPPLDSARYFAQFGAFNTLDAARASSSEHYGAVVVDGYVVGSSSRYVVVRATTSWDEAERVCAKFAEGQCYPRERAR